MVKRIGLIFIWFFASSFVLIWASSTLYYKNKINHFLSSKVKSQSLTQENNNLSGQVLGVQISDSRPFQITNFLKRTPLEPYSDYIVEVSDKYGLDWRLIPAIAMKETGGGIASPKNSYNAWGFENGGTRFESWETAIDRVGKTLKDKYVAKGLITPEQIMPVYAPPSILNGGTWARDVNFFFFKLETL